MKKAPKTNGSTSGGSNQCPGRKGADIPNSVFIDVENDLGEEKNGIDPAILV